MAIIPQRELPLAIPLWHGKALHVRDHLIERLNHFAYLAGRESIYYHAKFPTLTTWNWVGISYSISPIRYADMSHPYMILRTIYKIVGVAIRYMPEPGVKKVKVFPIDHAINPDRKTFDEPPFTEVFEVSAVLDCTEGPLIEEALSKGSRNVSTHSQVALWHGEALFQHDRLLEGLNHLARVLYPGANYGDGRFSEFPINWSYALFGNIPPINYEAMKDSYMLLRYKGKVIGVVIRHSLSPVLKKVRVFPIDNAINPAFQKISGTLKEEIFEVAPYLDCEEGALIEKSLVNEKLLQEKTLSALIEEMKRDYPA